MPLSSAPLSPAASARVLACILGLVAIVVPACSGKDGGGITPTVDGGPDGGPGTDAGTDGEGGVDPGKGPGDTPVTECGGAALAPATSGTCAVTKKGTAGLLIKGAIVASDKVLLKGSVLVGADGKIACTDCDCSGAAGASEATVIECADGVVSPGLINLHDHITFANSPPHAAQARRYNHRHEWRTACPNPDGELKTLGNAKTVQVQFAEFRHLLSGTTSIAGSGGVDKIIRNLDRAVAQQEGLGQAVIDFETFPLGDSGGTCPRMVNSCAYPAVPAASSLNAIDSYLPHVAEGINPEARNEFLCLSSEGNGAHDVVGPKSAFVHSIGITAGDVDKMRNDGTSVIWSPRSNIDLYGNTAQVTMIDRMGGRIALGTDWTASGSINLLRELRCADSLNTNHFGGYFSNEKLWRMVTINAARAGAVDDVIGDLKAGLFADIAIYRASATKKLHRAVIAADPQDVALVLRGGTVMHGDGALVEALDANGAACDQEDVCGEKKRICVSREIGQTLAALKAASVNAPGEGPNEPLFHCTDPANEPTCKPARPNEYTGDITGEDLDGDGITGAADNCPRIFNPIRPMDNGKQPDEDADGVGDVCDPCPLDANKTECGAPDTSDSDRDGVANDADNCPNRSNPDQKDADGDKAGDACDACPTIANPGNAPCALSIHDLRDPALGRSALGSSVKLAGVHVTHVRSSGYYARDAAGRDYAGIYIFTGGAPTAGGAPVTAGMIVSVQGQFVEFQGAVDELTSPTTTVDAATGGNVTPVDVTTAELTGGSVSGEKLEALLVRVQNVTVKVKIATDDDFYATDTPATEQCTGTPVPACVRISDFLLDAAATNNVPATTVGQTFTSIVGVVDGFQKQQALNVRVGGDLVTP